MTILGLEHSAQFLDIVTSHERGEISQTVMWGSCPQLRSISGAGRFPYSVHVGKGAIQSPGNPKNWDQERERHARRMLQTWTEYAPNIAIRCLDYSAQTPARHRATFRICAAETFSSALCRMARAVIPSVSRSRMLPGVYSEPLSLRLSSHPGGNITGLPGYNCAQVLLADMGIPLNFRLRQPVQAAIF